MKLDLDRIGTELGQKAKIEENPPMQRRKKQAGLGKKLKNRIFAPTGRRKKQAGLGEKLKNRIFAPTERNKTTKIKISGGKLTWIL